MSYRIPLCFRKSAMRLQSAMSKMEIKAVSQTNTEFPSKAIPVGWLNVYGCVWGTEGWGRGDTLCRQMFYIMYSLHIRLVAIYVRCGSKKNNSTMCSSSSCTCMWPLYSNIQWHMCTTVYQMQQVLCAFFQSSMTDSHHMSTSCLICK